MFRVFFLFPLFRFLYNINLSKAKIKVIFYHTIRNAKPNQIKGMDKWEIPQTLSAFLTMTHQRKCASKYEMIPFLIITSLNPNTLVLHLYTEIPLIKMLHRLACQYRNMLRIYCYAKTLIIIIIIKNCGTTSFALQISICHTINWAHSIPFTLSYISSSFPFVSYSFILDYGIE